MESQVEKLKRLRFAKEKFGLDLVSDECMEKIEDIEIRDSINTRNRLGFSEPEKIERELERAFMSDKIKQKKGEDERAN